MAGIRDIPVPRPPDGESLRSALVEVRRADEQAQRLAQGVAQSQTRVGALRRALLTAAFTGRLSGRSSDMDVAEELVEAVS